jgi:predicted dehydrogenase
MNASIGLAMARKGAKLSGLCSAEFLRIARIAPLEMMMKKLKHVRFGVIGLGMMGGLHVQMFKESKARNYSLTCVSDIDAPLAKKIGEKYDLPYFDCGFKMIDSGLCDVVIVAVPHYWHAPLTIYAARKGLHVMCEKPLSATISDARLMVAECKKNKVSLGVMLHHRARADMNKVKQIIDSGKIGEVFRAQLICSNWFRTQAYYDSGAWRGTWDGEGGGVLINQAPHHFDLFQWLAGMPKRLMGLISTRCHKIEVEDCGNFLMDYGKGKVGYIYTTTAEEPGYEQFMFCGDKGTIIVEDGKIKLGMLAMPVSKHIFASESAMAGGAEQKIKWTEVKVPTRKEGHLEINAGFARHLISGKPFEYCTGVEALNELELSNAMHIAGYKEKVVTLPVDGAEMDRLLAKLERERSIGKGGGIRKKAKACLNKLMKQK